MPSMSSRFSSRLFCWEETALGEQFRKFKKQESIRRKWTDNTVMTYGNIYCVTNNKRISSSVVMKGTTECTEYINTHLLSHQVKTKTLFFKHWIYPKALEVARLQQVPQVQDLSDGALLLLRHCSQGNSPPQPRERDCLPSPFCTHTPTLVDSDAFIHVISCLLQFGFSKIYCDDFSFLFLLPNRHRPLSTSRLDRNTERFIQNLISQHETV